MYMRMMRYYLELVSRMPPVEAKRYRDAAASLKVCFCGTSALPQPINDFWTGMLATKIVQRYGSTELGIIFNMSSNPTEDVPDGSVGELTYGVDVKLSGGDEGEVLAKSANMFSKYIHDPEATASAHDEDGYFKSGDVARREGKYYYMVGRASVDIIKSGGYKISALDIERELLALPYIGEAMVDIPDMEFGQRVGAVVSLRDDEAAQEFYKQNNRHSEQLNLDHLRAEVRNWLAGYKMLKLLRIIKGELPKNGTGKVVKKLLGRSIFHQSMSRTEMSKYGEVRQQRERLSYNCCRMLGRLRCRTSILLD
jgi:malonyl-CoA/methylmalonyl-CoA synthetase